MIIEPCCDHGGARPVSSPTRVTLFHCSTLAEIASSFHMQTVTAERRGLRVSQIDAIGANDDGLAIDIHFETLDPCPYMVKALARKIEWDRYDPEESMGRDATPAERDSAAKVAGLVK